ncbi:sensor domain-containing protein [Actinokineospora diospyrosa]|uniref:Sensor n=1 Tax=Actinokineospora diospyrosa TaxID=103728 RepID=A0ABT1IA07_9PSEU|nr:sensor domain-containing protein [Actinokineospora diospyrosa]MCP2269470.1 putative sensor [Actinokineospora diospyrosa]
MTTIQSDGSRPNPSVLGSLGYLAMNLPVGIAGFVAVVTLFSVGIGTAVVWVGLPVLAVAILGARVAARVERARVYAMLDTYIASPYVPLPERGRWKARVRDVATWRDVSYFVLLFPIGIFEFVVMVTMWSLTAGLLFLPFYYRFLPTGSWRVGDWDHPFLVVDSFIESLPFAALGLLLLALALPVTKGLGRAHAYFARSLLGPAPSLIGSYRAEPLPSGV